MVVANKGHRPITSQYATIFIPGITVYTLQILTSTIKRPITPLQPSRPRYFRTQDGVSAKECQMDPTNDSLFTSWSPSVPSSTCGIFSSAPEELVLSPTCFFFIFLRPPLAAFFGVSVSPVLHLFLWQPFQVRKRTILLVAILISTSPIFPVLGSRPDCNDPPFKPTVSGEVFIENIAHLPHGRRNLSFCTCSLAFR